jgi:hypothetical protein
MKWRMMSVGLALLALSTACLAADATAGTWKLNAAKSKPAPGGAKYDTVTIASEGANMKVTLDGTDTAGKPVHSEWVGKYDGKQYPVNGNPDMETGAYKKVDDHTFQYTAMKGGKPTTSAKITYSADGKTRTVHTSVTDAKGKKVSGMSLYDKQ